MHDQERQIPAMFGHLPWNKGKLTGAKPPLRPKPASSVWRTVEAMFRWPRRLIEGVDHGFVSFSLGLAGHSDLLVSRDAVGRC
jgi:hypothetical protein